MNISRFFIVAGLILALSTSAGAMTPKAKPLGEFGLALGGVFPQGDFVDFSDPGPCFHLRWNLRPRALKMASLRLEIGGNFFKDESNSVDIVVDTLLFPGEKTISQTAWTIHAGLQLGSPTRLGLIRPRASISPGLYIFNIRTSYKFEDAQDNLYSDDDTQVKFGWRGAVGTTLFFSTKWGLSFDFIYDHVYKLHQLEGRNELGQYTITSTAADFQTYSVGVVIPLDKL